MSHAAPLRYCKFRDEDFGYLDFLKLLVLCPGFPLHEGTANETANAKVNDDRLGDVKGNQGKRVFENTFSYLFSFT